MFVIGNEYKLKIKNGRMFVYQQDTTNLANIYTYEGSELVAAPNPFYVVDGDCDNSFVLDNNIYDYVIQEYEGDSTDPSGDLRPEMWHETYAGKLGFKDAPSAADEVVTVKKISGLKNAQPVNYAQVLGYWTPTDCEPRLYMWDANCSDTEDGGLVIKSNLSESGRWILLVSGQMKSQYYGVTSLAHQENLRKLLEYPKTIGSFGLVTPSDIIMAPCGDVAGTNPGYGFGTDTYNAYGKNIYCQYNAFFRKQCMIRCCSMHGTGVLGNYKIGYSFAGVQESNLCFQPVRMSNFHEMQHWLQCGSNTLIQDVKQYDWQFDQYNNQLSGDIVVNNAGIVCEQPFNFTRHPDIYTHLTMNACNIVGDPKFNGSVIFKNMKITDRWYTHPGFFYGEGALQSANNWQGCSAKDEDFTDMHNLFTYGEAIGKSAYDCSNKTIEYNDTIYLTANNNIIINNLNNAYGRKYLLMSARRMEFNNCVFDNGFRIYCPYVHFNNCNMIQGYWAPQFNGYAYMDSNMYGWFNNCYLSNAWENRVPTAARLIHVDFNNSDISECSAALSGIGGGWSGDFENNIRVNINGGNLGLGMSRKVVSANIPLTSIGSYSLGYFSAYKADDYLREKYIWKLEPWSENWGSPQPIWNGGGEFKTSYTNSVTTGFVYNTAGKIDNLMVRRCQLSWPQGRPALPGASTSQKVNLVRY